MNDLIASTRWFFALLMLGAFGLAQAAANPPQAVIEERYQSLQQLVDDNVLVAGMPNEELLALMERELSPVVDFPRVARKVMGKYARRASEQQLEQFTAVFKETLVSTYSKGLDQLDLLRDVVIEDAAFAPSGDRAQVPTEIILSSGERYKVIYTLFENNGQWLIENIVVEGVNIGLVFKNQFAHYMETYNRDIDQVIAHWGE